MIHQIMTYLQLNWFQDVIDVVAAINVISAGAKVMGWTKLADELSKVENAIKAMVDAALNRTPKTGA